MLVIVRVSILLAVAIAVVAPLPLPGIPPTPSAFGQSRPAEDAMPGMAHQSDADRNMNMGRMEHAAPAESADDSIRFSGRQWSIFNHRGAGWFLCLWGLTALVAGLQWPRRTWWRYVPPLVLFGLVEFLLIRNDPEAWPTGSIGLWASLKDPEVFQHRIFLLLLLCMAVLELSRAADRLPPALAKYGLPGLAAFGGVYLFFHKHGGAEMAQMMQHMSDPAMASSAGMKAMMSSMDLVKHEHKWFSICGFGLAASKLLGDSGRLKGRLGATLWTLFAIALGLYMIGYIE